MKTRDVAGRAPSPSAEAATTTPRAFETVIDHVEALILDGELRVDDRLPPEREMAQQLGVSRPAVREAIRTLEALGVLASHVGSGAGAGTHVINERSHALERVLRLQVALAQFPIDEVVDTRVTLERSACALAAANATDEQLCELTELAEAMSQEHDVREFNELDTAFHVRIATIGRNSLMGDLTQAVRQSLRLPILAAEEALDDWPGFRARLCSEHDRITAALRGRQAHQAAEHMEQHIRGAYHALDPSLLPHPQERG